MRFNRKISAHVCCKSVQTWWYKWVTWKCSLNELLCMYVKIIPQLYQNTTVWNFLYSLHKLLGTRWSYYDCIRRLQGAFYVQYINFLDYDDPTMVTPTTILHLACSGSPQLSFLFAAIKIEENFLLIIIGSECLHTLLIIPSTFSSFQSLISYERDVDIFKLTT